MLLVKSSSSWCCCWSTAFLPCRRWRSVSAKRSRLQAAADQGRAGARSALALLDDPTTFLSSIQIDITLISMVTGVYSGATLAAQLGAVLAGSASRRSSPRKSHSSWSC